MASKALKEAMRRAETWPAEVQEELAEIALEIDASLEAGHITRHRRSLKASTVVSRPRGKGGSSRMRKLKRSLPSIAVDESRLYGRGVA
jgi:hypothetical protein